MPAIAVGLLVGPLAIPAQAGEAKGHEIVTIECVGLGTVDISTQRSDNFGAVQIVGTRGHLIPVAFSFTLENVTKGTIVFSETEAKNGHRNQTSTTCTESFTGTWDEISEGAPPPPGVDPTDQVRFTLTAEVVPK